MNTIIIILLAAGFVYLVFFHKPENPSKSELKNWFSSRLAEISDILEKDIEQDKQGTYPHTGLHSFKKQGRIIYILKDKNGKRLDVSDRNPLTTQDIRTSAGYLQLQQLVHSLNLSLQLDENEIEVDDEDTDSIYQTDEHIDDYLRYYTVTISGW